MSRSLHTDPYPLRAARRTAAPYRRRIDEPRVTRTATGNSGGSSARVQVRVCPPRPGFVHPAGVNDITGLLAFFGPAAAYGLRRVELRQRFGGDRPEMLIAGLKVPGVVVLFELPSPPWTVAGRLPAHSSQRLRRAGALIRIGTAGTRIDWPGETLRDFVLFDGLMHEIGHHAIQHDRGKTTARVMRTADHERRADAFAAACRQAWTAR